MKLEQKNFEFLFSTTNIPDIFFTEYYCQSSGDFIKLYLYLLFLSKHNKDINLNDLSKKLALPLKTIKESIEYWEELGLLTKKPSGYIINNIQEIELHNLYSPKVTSSPETLEKNSKNKYRAKVIEDINNTCFQGMMSPSWYSDIDLWFNKYGFDEQVMFALFNYCFQRSALHRNYVQTVAEAWYKNNIKSYNELELYFEKQEKVNLIKKSIAKKLGFNRTLTVYESAYIEKWLSDYNYSLDIIEIALKRTTSKTNPNFDYIDKVLSDWHDRGLNTIYDIQNFLSSLKQKNKNIKELEKKSNHKIESRTYDNLDSLFANNA